MARSPDAEKIEKAAEQLSRLLERELSLQDGQINPIALRLLMQAHWTKVSTLAHAVHGSK